MICGFCGCEFDEKNAKTGCGGCPGGCHNIHCPRCNYKNPQETPLTRRIQQLFSKKDVPTRRKQ